jgi:hypothetical protein
MANFDDYAWLASDPAATAALAALADDRRPELQQLNELRKSLSPERARLVAEQAALRRRAAAKFGPAAAKMFFTSVQLEQATDRTIAAYKADRLAAGRGTRLVHDYCCGIGGDLLAFASRCPAIGWELSPVARLFAEKNLAALPRQLLAAPSTTTVREADVSDLTPAADERWHVDPDRRNDGRRSTTLDYHSPGPAVIDRWRAAAPDGVVKLAPASDPPANWQREGELEWITSHRECRQLVVWFGGLAAAPGQRRATAVIPQRDDAGAFATPAVASFVGAVGDHCNYADEPQQFLYEPDPSIIAAGLLSAIAERHSLRSLGAGGTYLTGNDELADPLLAGFAIAAALPLRTAAVAQWLAARDVGRVEVKKRGVAIDLEKFRRDLKLRGDGEATVLLTRAGKRQLAIIAQRLESRSV